MAKVELKQPVVQEIAEKIDGAQSIVLVDHRGLTVAQDTELRRQLREAGVDLAIMDCFGYGKEMSAYASAAIGKPVILSRMIAIRVLLEIV